MSSISYDTDDQLDGLIPKVSNWGKWGKNDVLGTLNYLTPKHVKQSAQLIKSGKVISLSRESVISRFQEINAFF